MSITRTFLFPDGTSIRCEDNVGHLWAIAAPPMSADEIARVDADQMVSILAEIKDLEAAIANPTVVIESTDQLDPVLRIAGLDKTSVSTIVDEDNDVVDFGDHLDPDGPLFPKTGESLEKALIAEAMDRISALRRSIENLLAERGPGRTDSRRVWHITRRTAEQSRAILFADQMNEARGSAAKVILVLASPPE